MHVLLAGRSERELAATEGAAAGQGAGPGGAADVICRIGSGGFAEAITMSQSGGHIEDGYILGGGQTQAAVPRDNGRGAGPHARDIAVEIHGGDIGVGGGIADGVAGIRGKIAPRARLLAPDRGGHELVVVNR